MLDIVLDIPKFDRFDDLSDCDEETQEMGRMFYWIETICPEIVEPSLDQQQWLAWGK